MNKLKTLSYPVLVALDVWTDIINQELKKQNLSYAELARKMNLDRKTISAWLNLNRTPRLEYVIRMYQILGLKEINIPID